METTEKIVESYCRYIKDMFTISNIKCGGQHEIDLLAIKVTSKGDLKRYHIESSVSISDSFSKLTANPFSLEKLKHRTKGPSQRKTIGFFKERKFGPKEVLDEISKYGFKDNNYSKVIVTWDYDKKAKEQADDYGIEIWDFHNILKRIKKYGLKAKSYFKDDTLRTIQLLAKSKIRKK